MSSSEESEQPACVCQEGSEESEPSPVIVVKKSVSATISSEDDEECHASGSAEGCLADIPSDEEGTIAHPTAHVVVVTASHEETAVKRVVTPPIAKEQPIAVEQPKPAIVVVSRSPPVQRSPSPVIAPIYPILVVSPPIAQSMLVRSCAYRVPAVQKSFSYVYSWKFSLDMVASGKYDSEIGPNVEAVKIIRSLIGDNVRPAFVPTQVELKSSYNSSPFHFVVSCKKWLMPNMCPYITGAGRVGNFEIIPGKTVCDVGSGGLVLYATGENIKEKIDNEMPCGFAGYTEEDLEKGVMHREKEKDYIVPKGSAMAAVINEMGGTHADVQATIDPVTGNYVIPESAYDIIKAKFVPRFKSMRNYMKSFTDMKCKLRFVTNEVIANPSDFVTKQLTDMVPKAADDVKNALKLSMYDISATIFVSGWFFLDPKP